MTLYIAWCTLEVEQRKRYKTNANEVNMAKKFGMTTKASIASGVFGVTPRTLRGWHCSTNNSISGSMGIPGRKRDAFYRIVERRARLEGNPIQGTPKQIKDRLGDPQFVLVCLRHAFPGVWI